MQLLSNSELLLLKHIIKLLHRVTQQPTSKMTPFSLSTVMSPALITPDATNPDELGSSRKVMEELIHNADAIFELPDRLVAEVHSYWAYQEQSPATHEFGEDLEDCRLFLQVQYS